MDNNQNNFEQENFEQEKFDQEFTEPTIPLEPETKKPILAVKDPLFLVMCILISVSVAFAFNIFNLLLVIGMWIAFACVNNESTLLSGAKLCAGTMKANYIVLWVVIGLGYLAGVLIILLTLAAPVAFTNTYFIDSLLEIDGVGEAFESVILSGVAYEVVLFIMLLFCGIFTIIMATALIFVNIFFNRNVCKFANSIRDNIANGTPIIKAKTVSIWLIVFSVFQGLSLLGLLYDFESLISTGTIFATYIIAYIWIKKHFIKT